MKYLLVLAVVAVAIWIWRNNRREDIRAAAPRPARPPAVPGPQAMVRCAHCGLHLPAADAVSGRSASYCTVAHRQAAEG